MAHTLFISDLHLKPTRQDLNQGFVELCASEIARTADALYILGDFVEFWIGDDTPTTGINNSLSALKQLGQSGVKLYFQHGNRDFLVGQGFAKEYGIALLGDEAVIDLYGQPTLLLHGDTLCTDDIDYQNFRAMVREPSWQQEVLSKSLYGRIQYAQEIREKTTEATKQKSAEIMDVNQNAVVDAFQRHQLQHMIHGHTHRPAQHVFTHERKEYSRVVLSDWDEAAHYYAVFDDGRSEVVELEIDESLGTQVKAQTVKVALAGTLVNLFLFNR